MIVFVDSSILLAGHVERLARRAAPRDLLDEWDEKFGPVPEEDLAAARAAFDELDGTTESRCSA